MQATPARPSASFLFLTYLFAALIGALAMALARAYQAGFSGADEPSHFLNGYFISNYLTHSFGSNPMGSAADFYIHYPKISIGHWPPAYYGFLGLLFLVLPPTIPVAFAINVLVSALPAIGVGAALSLLSNRRAALAGVVIYALAPLALEGQAMFMVDQPLTACLVAATAVWIRYVQRGGWGWAIGFAALAALAVLIKGNGWLVGLIPVFHIVFTKNWRLLRSVSLYGAGALAALVVVPWYMLTAKISADGFNYHAGFAYASQALLANLLTLVQNLTPVGVLLALFDIVVEYRSRKLDPTRWMIVSAIISLILATLTLQSIIPVDIVDRYMAPALPAAVVLSVLGAYRLILALRARGRQGLSTALATVLLLMLIAPGVAHLIHRQPKADTGTALVSQQLAAGGTSVTVIDGTAAAEGAFIADMAVRDRSLTSYVIRASKLLADSNFMGSDYALKFHDSQRVLDELRRLGVQHVVVVRNGDRPAFPHSEQLRTALLGRDSGFVLREKIPHRYRAGTTEVYDAVGSVTPNIQAVRDLGLPDKASSIVKLN
jgi:hypothetical protein